MSPTLLTGIPAARRTIRGLILWALIGATLTLRGQNATAPAWPTPGNPTPAGWVEWSLQNGGQKPAFPVTKEGQQYFVTFTVIKSEPKPRWPLWSAGEAPEALHFYESTVPTTPGVSILVYRAGSLTSPTATGNVTLTIERAVIVASGSNQALGDALWAVRPPAGSAPLPQPTWTWAPDKLTVTNPFEKTIQEIALTPKAAK